MSEEKRQNENLQRLNEEAQNSQMASEIPEELVEEQEEFQDETEEENEPVGELVVGINADLNGKQLLCVCESGYVGKASDYLEAINVIKNLDTQRICITLRHVSNYCDTEVNVELSKLKKTQLFNTLTSKGIVMYEWCAGALSEYLIEQIDGFIKQGKMLFQHEQLGWSDALDKSKGFFASNSIGAPYSSIIRGNDDGKIGSHGDRAVYDEMIEQEVIPNKSLHLPFVLAFTGPIVPLMYGKSACPVLMINFAGKSSQGKTTSLALMASVWGRGIIDNDRLSVIKTFASTQNGFEAAVNSNNGVPVLFDDYEAASKSLSFGSLIYTLAQGESKIRCDKYGHAKDTYQWRTTIALTGESSIFDRAGHNLGLRPRIVEFKNKAWTVSKENSINITSVVSNNYGFLGEKFAESLIPMSQEELDAYYDVSNAAIEKLLPSKDNISDRIQTRLVLIRMTAELVKAKLGLDIDVDYITNFLVENEQNRQSSLDIYEEAKEKLFGYITSNLSRFVRTDKQFEETSLPNSTIVGRIYGGPQGYTVMMLSDAFKSLIADFNDKDAILEHWRDEGFLIVDKDRKRFTKKVKITSQTVPCRCYVFLFNDTSGKLKDFLSEGETIVPQDLVDEDRENRLNGITGEPPKYAYFHGKKYALVEGLEKGVENRKHYAHDFSNVPHSSPVDDTPKETPVISTSNYDDSETIESIFNKEESEEENND